MRRRVTLFVLIAVATATVVAGSPWRTVAKAPRGALPDVEITLGYPGPYIPTWNAPIELRATAHRPFNGYIGWHYAVGMSSTADGSVISRVKLASGQRWRFASWSRIEPPGLWRSLVQLNRELVIEWRDGDMNVVAEQSVGVPPWSGDRPLLVGSDSGLPLLGTEPVVMSPDGLSTSAQWYSGFKAVALPVDAWTELPARVREAIVGSGVLVVFIGFPADARSLPPDQRVLLPVEFVPGQAQYAVPWPFRGHGTTITTPLGWRVRSGSRSLGADPPPVVIDDDAVWVAGEALLEQPLPAVPSRSSDAQLLTESRWSMREMVSLLHRPAFAGAILFLFSIGAWWSTRRAPRWTLVGILLAGALVALLARGSSRLQQGGEIIDSYVDRGGGISVHRRRLTQVGAAPLGTAPVERALRDTAVFANLARYRRLSEVRDSATPIGFGARESSSGWEFAERAWLRRELRPAAKVSIVSVEKGRLVIDYAAPADVEYAFATWFADGRKFYGEVRLGHPRKGRVAIANRMFRPRVDASDIWYGNVGGTPVRDWVYNTARTEVRLYRKERSGWTRFEWREAFSARELDGRSFVIQTWMTPTPDGRLTCTILVPPHVARAGMRVNARLYGKLGVGRLTVATENSTDVLENETGPRPLRTAMFSSGVGAFRFPESFATQLAAGGLIVLSVEPVTPLEPGQTAEIIVTFEEKKS